MKEWINKKPSPIFYLIGGIVLGSTLGIYFPKYFLFLKPIGDIFINLIFVAVVPLVFFTISSSIATLSVGKTMRRIFGVLIFVFIGTLVFAATIALIILHFHPVYVDLSKMNLPTPERRLISGNQLVQMFSVAEFNELFSRKALLPLMIFSLLIGTAARRSGIAGESVRFFLTSANTVIKNVFKIVMRCAPIGLGVYFGCNLANMGSQIAGGFAQMIATAYFISLFYYFLAFTAYAWLAGGIKTVYIYWKNNIVPSATAVATCSSIASLPSNLEASQKMGIPGDIGDVVITMGMIFHKEGTVIASIIALFVINRGISGWDASLFAVLLAVLISVIEGSVPNGGYTAQLLIASLYHLPTEIFPVMMVIGILLDPIATLLNVAGNTASSLLIFKFMKEQKNY